MIEGMDFGDVVRAVRSGQEVRRKSWRSDWRIAEVNETLVTFVGGPVGWCAWTPTYSDIFAEDWELVQ